MNGCFLCEQMLIRREVMVDKHFSEVLFHLVLEIPQFPSKTTIISSSHENAIDSHSSIPFALEVAL